MGSRALYIGVHSSAVKNVVGAVRKIIQSGDVGSWEKFCERLKGVQFAPTLDYSKYILAITGPSLFHIEEHRGLPAFQINRIPTAGDPGLGWVVRKVLEESASLKMHSRFEGLLATLLDGFDRNRWIQSESDKTTFDTIVSTLFDSPMQTASNFAEDLKFLADDDEYWSITSSIALAELFAHDREVALRNIAETLRSAGEPITENLGSELLRIIHFVNLLLVDKLDLWISEPYT